MTDLQETIFVADGSEDYLTHCRMSGEPLLKSMIPEEEDRKLPAITPYVQTLVGRPWSRSTYEVSHYPYFTTLFSFT